MTNEEVKQIKINKDFEGAEYNGISIIRHIKTGFVNATKICIDNNRRFKNLTDTDRWHKIIGLYNEEIAFGEKTPDSKLWFVASVSNDLRGSYIHPKLVHHVAEWADLKYAIRVGRIMDAINENNKEKLDKEVSDLISKIVTDEKVIFEQSVRVENNEKRLLIIRCSTQVDKIEEDKESKKSKPILFKLSCNSTTNSKSKLGGTIVNTYVFPASLNIKQELRNKFKKHGSATKFVENELPDLVKFIISLNPKSGC
jgi:hypothetical protein